MKHFFSFLIASSILLSCQENNSNENSSEAMAEAAISENVEAVQKDYSESEAVETSNDTELQNYESFLKEIGNRNTHQIYTIYNNTIDGVLPSNIQKCEYEYKDNFYSLWINKNDTTYFGIFEKLNNQPVVHYVSIEPQIFMEGNVYANYNNEPWFEYFFENNELTKITHHNNSQKKELKNSNTNQSDSIKKVIFSKFNLENSPKNFRGNWNYYKNSDDYSFNLSIKQRGSFIQGEYCAYTTSKSDCGVPEQGGEPCFVNGFVYEDTLYLDFKSCYSGKTGNGKLYYKNDSLHWVANYIPENALFPSEALLLRSNN